MILSLEGALRVALQDDDRPIALSDRSARVVAWRRHGDEGGEIAVVRDRGELPGGEMDAECQPMPAARRYRRGSGRREQQHCQAPAQRARHAHNGIATGGPRRTNPIGSQRIAGQGGRPPRRRRSGGARADGGGATPWCTSTVDSRALTPEPLRPAPP